MMDLKKDILHNDKFSWLQFASNWLMQGIYLADWSEKLYKIFFTLFFWTISFIIFFEQLNFSFAKSVIMGFLFGHTLNWFINNNFFVILVHRIKWLKTSKIALFNHLSAIQGRLEKMPNKEWLLYSVSLGGICNGTLNEHSDIDVILIRKPGFKNLIKAIVFYVKEKKYADIAGVPLDIMICDTPQDCINKSKNQKNPIVLLDPNNQVNTYYPDNLKMSIVEAKKLNNVAIEQ